MPRAPNAISPRIIQGLLAQLSARGVDERALRERIGLTAADISDEEGGTPASIVTTLFAEAERLLGDELLGIHLAQSVPLGLFGYVYHSLHASDTLRDAYRRAVRYQALASTALRASLTEEHSEATIRIEPAPGAPTSPQITEYVALFLLRMGRAATASTWSPRRVSFSHRDRPAEVLMAVFGAPVELGAPHTELLLDRATLELPVPTADASIAALLDHEASAALVRVTRAASMGEQVRGVIRTRLQDGEPGIKEVAARLHASPRSLQRWLASEGTTFAEQVDLVRRELALRYILQPHVGIMEVSFLTGFSDSSSFHRAFRRWTGMTPSQYRRSRGRQPPG